MSSFSDSTAMNRNICMSFGLGHTGSSNIGMCSIIICLSFNCSALRFSGFLASMPLISTGCGFSWCHSISLAFGAFIASAQSLSLGESDFVRRLGLTLRQLAVGAAFFAVCLAVVPLLIMGYFAARGVWSQFQYCVFAHNLEPATTKTYLNSLWLVGGVPILIYATRKFIRKETNPTVAFRQAFVCLTYGMYFLLLKGIWRHLTREDYLPLYPLVALVCVALLSRISDILSEWRLMPRLLLQFPLPAIAACLVMILDLALRIPVTNDAAKEVNRVRDVLALTNPDDSVFDCKGETVF